MILERSKSTWIISITLKIDKLGEESENQKQWRTLFFFLNGKSYSVRKPTKSDKNLEKMPRKVSYIALKNRETATSSINQEHRTLFTQNKLHKMKKKNGMQACVENV